jgi:hypothetical protein
MSGYSELGEKNSKENKGREKGKTKAKRKGKGKGKKGKGNELPNSVGGADLACVEGSVET